MGSRGAPRIDDQNHLVFGFDDFAYRTPTGQLVELVSNLKKGWRMRVDGPGTACSVALTDLIRRGLRVDPHAGKHSITPYKPGGPSYMLSAPQALVDGLKDQLRAGSLGQLAPIAGHADLETLLKGLPISQRNCAYSLSLPLLDALGPVGFAIRSPRRKGVYWSLQVDFVQPKGSPPLETRKIVDSLVARYASILGPNVEGIYAGSAARHNTTNIVEVLERSAMRGPAAGRRLGGPFEWVPAPGDADWTIAESPEHVNDGAVEIQWNVRRMEKLWLTRLTKPRKPIPRRESATTHEEDHE